MFYTSGKQNGAAHRIDVPVRRLRAAALPCLALAFGLLLFALPGCGKKTWPEPDANQERYDFTDAVGRIRDNCLQVKARLSGNKDNIAKIVLELAATGTDTDCPTCPFHPEMRIAFALTNPQLKIGRKSLSLQYCLLDPGVSYRWRLVGYNSYTGLGAVASRVIMTSPSPDTDQDNPQDADAVEMNYTDMKNNAAPAQ